MKRLKMWFTAAAVAFVAAAGALTLPQTLEQEAATQDPPVDCREWKQAIASRDSRRIPFWLAISNAEIGSVPEAFDSRVLGTRRGRKMVISRTGCPGEYTYEFEVSAPTNGIRIAKTQADPYIARAWELYATATDGVVFLKGYKETPQACLDDTGLTRAQCLSLLRSINDCWIQADGSLCRYGYKAAPAPDNGGPVACSPTAASTWTPCVVSLGESPDTLRTQDFPDLSGE